MNHDELVRIAEQQFTNFPCTSTSLPTLTPCRFTGSEMRMRDDSMPYAHIAMAVEVRTTVKLNTLQVLRLMYVDMYMYSVIV